jgi:hypothetical protein
MNEHRPEVADVFRTYEKEFFAKWGHVLSPQQRKAFEAIRDCRTAALGGHVEYVEQCDTCGHLAISYNSCRNRHCPKCQAAARAKWLAARDRPSCCRFRISTLCSRCRNRSAAGAAECARDLRHPVPRRIGNVAHDCGRSETAGRGNRLSRRSPYLGAEPSPASASALRRAGRRHQPDGESWIGCRKESFFLPVKVLGSRFRNVFLTYLRKRFRKASCSSTERWPGLANRLHSKRCAAGRESNGLFTPRRHSVGPEQVLKYLARYTHRVAISNSRMISMEDGKVTFLWKDYADGSKTKVMTLDAVEFIRRFLLHILPPDSCASGSMVFWPIGLAARTRHQLCPQRRVSPAASGIVSLHPDTQQHSSIPASEARNTFKTHRLRSGSVQPDSIGTAPARIPLSPRYFPPERHR